MFLARRKRPPSVVDLGYQWRCSNPSPIGHHLDAASYCLASVRQDFDAMSCDLENVSLRLGDVGVHLQTVSIHLDAVSLDSDDVGFDLDAVGHRLESVT